MLNKLGSILFILLFFSLFSDHSYNLKCDNSSSLTKNGRILYTFFCISSTIVSPVYGQELPVNQSFFSLLLSKDTTIRYAYLKVSSLVFENTFDRNSSMGIAKKGSYLPVISVGESWCAIVFNGKEGWVQRNEIDVVSKKKYLEAIYLKYFFLGAGLVLALVLLGVPIIRSYRKKREDSNLKLSNSSNKRALILSLTSTTVQRLVTNEKIALEMVLEEVGFEVNHIQNLDEGIDYIIKKFPEVIAIDWNMEPGIRNTIEQKLSSKASTTNLFIIFYNVPSNIQLEKNAYLPNTQFLGKNFSDRDLFNLITPFIITGEKKHAILKSVESASLKGSISPGSLIEVLQFIEISKKTGELQLVFNDEPEMQTSGVMFFRNGLIVKVYYGGKKDKFAIFAMLDKTAGSFQFVQNSTPGNEECSLQILGILMEWAKESDEIHRDRLRET